MALVILGLFLRLAPLGRYVTPDEPAWVYRAIRFADALAARDWAAVPSTGHPGVTTMWLGAIGVALRRLLAPAESAAHLEWIRPMAWLTPENGEAFRHLAFFLSPGRIAIALVTTLGLAVLYHLLARRFDRRVALLSVGLLAFDPFLIGHSSLLHTDALLATFILLALAAALNGLGEPHRATWWAASGLFTGLALLTKSPALVLLPFILLIITISHLRQPPTSNLQYITHCSLFIACTTLTLFALYPALWADPTGTLGTLFAFAGKHVETAQRSVFFLGQATHDPGPAFYPVVLLFRISPIVLVGLVAGLISLGRLPRQRRLAVLLLLAFAVGFGALMSLATKKHDRYLLPALLPLTLVAGIALDRYTTPKNVTNRPIALPIILGLQLLVALAFTRYPLTYTNPLAGGPWTAARAIAIDWGEGAGAAAHRLNELPNAERLTVAAVSVPSFAAVFQGRTLPLDQATRADYAVLPPQQSSDSPITPISIGCMEHAAILSNTIHSRQAAYLAAHAGTDDVIVLDADTPLLRQYTGPGTLTSAADLPDRSAIAARLAELSNESAHVWLVTDPAAAPITAAHLRQQLDPPLSTVSIDATTITQHAIRSPAPAPHPSTQVNFGEQLVLVDALLPGDPVNAAFPVHLRWRVPVPTPTDLRASLYLRDAADHPWAEVGELVFNTVTYPTSAWASGEWTDDVLELGLPQHILPGPYAVEIVVADAQGAQLGAWNAENQFQGVRIPLGSVRIAPPAQPAGTAPCDAGRSRAADPFLTCVPEQPERTVPSGDVLTLEVTWSATAAPQADYDVRWRLLGTAGATALEQITDLATYPTSRWRAGDSFRVRYDLRIDPELPAADYALALNILAPDGRPLWSEDAHLATVHVSHRDRLFQLPDDVAHPLVLTLGNAIHLRGFDVSPVQENTLRPGDALSLTLYWQGDGPTDVDYTVFVHLVGPDGRPHGQVDQFPSRGAAPTSSWAPDQVVVDPLSLPVAPDAAPGTYHVAVGMYDAASGRRLPITAASGELLPDDQFVLPITFSVSGGSQ